MLCQKIELDIHELHIITYTYNSHVLILFYINCVFPLLLLVLLLLVLFVTVVVVIVVCCYLLLTLLFLLFLLFYVVFVGDHYNKTNHNRNIK